jgi:hypothetical protein
MTRRRVGTARAAKFALTGQTYLRAPLPTLRRFRSVRDGIDPR